METVVAEKFTINDDKSLLQLEVIHDFLAKSYWNSGIPVELLKKAVDNSFCAGVYCKQKQIGFARVVTDFSLNAYLCDVFILEEYRGLGLSKLLMEYLLSHPELKNIKAWRLATKDAHSLYSKYGFVPAENPERLMERKISLW